MRQVVYVSNADSGEISVLSLAPDGQLTVLHTLVLGGTIMPLAVSPCRHFLYAARRSEPLAVVSMAIDPACGRLIRLGEAALAGSMAYISTDRSGRYLLAASYPDDIITVSPINRDGVVGITRQTLPTGRHAHAIQATATNTHVIATSLGGNELMQLRFDPERGRLSINTPAAVAIRAGAGPRHFRFHPVASRVYLLNELDATIDTLAFDPAHGTLEVLGTTPSLPPGFDGEPWAADLQITPDGRFLYTCERRSSTLACFAIDPDDGHLDLIAHVPTETQPRSIAIDADGRWLLAAGQRSNHLSRYAIDPQTGALQTCQRIAVGKNPNWIEIMTLPTGHAE